MTYPESIRNLINQLTHWPAVGPKTAERFALYLLRQPQEQLNELARAIAEVKHGLTVCRVCCRLTDSTPCSICRDAQRERQTLCIVAESKDLLAIENTGRYHGLYHVLGGVINTVHNTRPGDYNLKSLIARLDKEPILEIILALNPDLEGETTALYLQKILTGRELRLTKLARGLPTGASLDYADDLTIGHAFTNRQQLK
ncbi:MAG: recombination mediator RecR [Candidatus Falkowbacteria bacterium]